MRWISKELISNVLVPVRVLVGRYDRIARRKGATQLADGLVAGEAAVIERAGHRAMEERPLDVARHVEELCQIAITGEAREHETTKYGGLSS